MLKNIEELKKMVKVVKFGGSSLASAEQFAKVGDIIRADESRKYVVPSAPGKRNSKDTKVTDMLYACYALAEADEDFRVQLMKIKERYDSIINGLGLKISLDEEFKKISENFKAKAGSDYAASRGEYLNGIIMANYLGYEFIDSATVIFFDKDGNFDADKTDKVLSKKNYPPGQHGNSRKRKTSEYGVQLREKQKAKYTYGVLEKQFRNLFEKAETAKGITGEILLQLLEGRLDNIVFRLGIAPTRAAARQLVSHKHITVDGEVVNIPSYAVKPGQVIGVRERSKSLEVIANSLAGFNHSKYPWLEWDDNSKVGKLLHVPERADIPENIKEHLIVELYSK